MEAVVTAEDKARARHVKQLAQIRKAVEHSFSSTGKTRREWRAVYERFFNGRWRNRKTLPMPTLNHIIGEMSRAEVFTRIRNIRLQHREIIEGEWTDDE